MCSYARELTAAAAEGRQLSETCNRHAMPHLESPKPSAKLACMTRRRSREKYPQLLVVPIREMWSSSIQERNT